MAIRSSIAALGLVLAGMPAWAAAISGAVTGGTALTNHGTYVQLTVPWGNLSTPANTVGNNNFQTWNLYEFNEVQDLILTAPLSVDVGTGAATVIPAGTTVSSQYVFFNPAGGGGDLIGNVHFDAPVLGIITSDAKLGSSNTLLGVSGVSYQDPASVGLEAGDVVSIDKTNADQIDWNTSASNPGDSVRVITGVATTVPEPGTLWLSGSLLAGMILFIRRKPRLN